LGVLWEHNYKTDVQQVWSYQVHANKESVSTFSLDKLEKIHRSYKAEIKIKTILNHLLSEGNSTIEISNNYDVNPENMVTANDGSDCSRDSAKDIIENDAIIVTASNQQEISTNIMDKVQDTTLEAVTSAETRDNTIDTQTSLPSRIALQQTRSETIQNAGEIYRSDANWYCRHCKLSGDRFYIDVHVCKGCVPM